MNLFKIIIFLFIISCSKNITLTECEELSMKAFKGFPSAAHQFKRNCSSFSIKYTKEVCQKALLHLMMKTSPKELKEKFGPKIMECFTKNDLEKFLNP